MVRRSRLSRNGGKPRAARLSRWVDESTEYAIVFRSAKDPSLTVEAYSYEPATEEELVDEWYVFPARNGKGIPSSPDLVATRKEALQRAKEIMKEYE